MAELFNITSGAHTAYLKSKIKPTLMSRCCAYEIEKNSRIMTKIVCKNHVSLVANVRVKMNYFLVNTKLLPFVVSSKKLDINIDKP